MLLDLEVRAPEENSERLKSSELRRTSKGFRLDLEVANSSPVSPELRSLRQVTFKKEG